MPDLPTGRVTFLFTDIEGSTRLLQHLGDAEGARIFGEHRRLLRAAVAARGGVELDDLGDGFLIVFPSAADAVRAAVDAQRALAAHPWPAGGRPRVRMGLHSGDPVRTGGRYVGLDVHRAARICQAAWGDQILVSAQTRELLDAEPGVTLEDLGLHRLKDLQRAERVFQVRHPELPADFPPPRALDPRTTNLPVLASTFIGRQRELGAVRDLVLGHRLVTLTGPGGVGKTRLVLQVAADLVDAFPDGLWLVELGGMVDGESVAREAAAVLAVREQVGTALLETLAHTLAARSLLLVLDNCEHVIAACAGLVDRLLRGCPNVKVLGTSREPLGIPGERLFPVPPLALPDPARPQAPEDADAVQLFIDRARAVRPGFRVVERDMPLLVELCRRLDGLPLAIELAAARTGALSIADIARHLGERFRLLTGGARTAPARHRTLRAALDWSHDLLGDRERAVFRRLGVFAGGFTLADAEAVCAGTPVAAGDVLDLLAGLVDRSLIVVEVEGEPVRYRLLETVREYALERLRDAAEEARIRARHAEWVLALAERAEPELRGHQQSDWLIRLQQARDDLRAGLRHLIGGPEPGPALRLAAALLWFWDTRGDFAEGRDWLRRALAAPGPSPPAVRARALAAAGHLAWHQSDYREAVALIAESLELATALDDGPGIAQALWFQGLVLSEEGDHPEAAAAYERALALYRELGDRRGAMETLLWLGFTQLARGDAGRAEEIHTAALQLARDLGGTRGIAIALRGLGQAAHARGELGRAKALYEESLARFREIGARTFYPGLLKRLGDIAWMEGDHDRAERLFQECLACCQEMGEKAGIAASLESLARVVATRGGPERGLRLLAAATRLRDQVGRTETFWKREDVRAIEEAARDALGADRYQAVWSAGVETPLAQVIDAALGRGEDAPR